MVQNTAEVQSSQLSFFMTDRELKKATQEEIGDQLDQVIGRISEVQEKMRELAKSLQGPSHRYERYDDYKTKERDLALLTEGLAALRAYHEKLKHSWYQKEKLDKKAS